MKRVSFLRSNNGHIQLDSHRNDISGFVISVKSAPITIHTKMTEQQKQCDECSALVDETKGRMVILNRECPRAEGEVTGFHWSFLCIQCVRDWRERGLKREELSPEQVLEKLNREYPMN